MALGPSLGRFWRPSWGQVGPMLALGPLKKSIQKTSQKTYTKNGPRVTGESYPIGGGPLEQRKKGIKETKGDKNNAKGTPRRTRRGGGYMYFCTLAWYGKLKF